MEGLSTRASAGTRGVCALGRATPVWQDTPADALAFRTGDILVLTNLGADAVPLPAGARVLLTSEPLDDDGRVPTDVTVWAAV